MISGCRVVDEMNSSGRVNTHLTGRPVFFDSSASAGSVVISFLPPKLPPTMVRDDADAAHRNPQRARDVGARQRDAPDASPRS